MSVQSVRPRWSRSAAALAALGAAASIAVATPATANAAIAIPEVPEWVTKVLPTPEQVKDGSNGYSELIKWLGGEDVRGALGQWNELAGGAGGLLPVFGSESKYTNGRDSDPSKALPGSIHFKHLFERADMKGFYDLVGKDTVGLMNIAEFFAKDLGTVLDRHENTTSIDWLFLSGSTRLANSYASMPGFSIPFFGDVPEFAIWIPEAKGDYTSIGGSGFGFNNSLPTMALPGLGAIPLPHLAGYVTAPFGLGGVDYFLKTQLPTFGADGSMGLGLPAFGGSFATPLGKIGVDFTKAASISILDGGFGLGFGSPAFTWVDPLGTTHNAGFTLGGISYTESGGLKVNGPDFTYSSTPAPKPAATTFDVAVPEVAAVDEERASTADAPVADVPVADVPVVDPPAPVRAPVAEAPVAEAPAVTEGPAAVVEPTEAPAQEVPGTVDAPTTEVDEAAAA